MAERGKLNVEGRKQKDGPVGGGEAGRVNGHEDGNRMSTRTVMPGGRAGSAYMAQQVRAQVGAMDPVGPPNLEGAQFATADQLVDQRAADTKLPADLGQGEHVPHGGYRVVGRSTFHAGTPWVYVESNHFFYGYCIEHPF